MRIFSKIYDISISAVELRHYYSTYINYLVKHKELTEKEHRKICDIMKKIKNMPIVYKIYLKILIRIP
jgi:hypothetical protein